MEVKIKRKISKIEVALVGDVFSQTDKGSPLWSADEQQFFSKLLV